MDRDAYRFKPPKPNYLPHNVDIDEPVVENYDVPMGRADDRENAIFYNKMNTTLSGQRATPSRITPTRRWRSTISARRIP
jgi:hypothetical protein